jgi:hypothetical protein
MTSVRRQYRRPSRQPRDFSFGIKMLRLPAEFGSRLGAAQALIEAVGSLSTAAQQEQSGETPQD